MTIRLIPIAAAFSVVLAACSPAADAPRVDESPDAVADGTAPSPPVPPQPPSEPAPPAPIEPSTPAYDESLINFGGYRTAPFNADAAAVRAAFDGALAESPAPDAPEACHYLIPTPPGPDGYRIGFMFEGAKFVRVDIDDPAIVAPGGIAIGMTGDDVRAAFPGVEAQPHKYTDGQYLIVAPADGGEARLIFETDDGGRVEEWRIGLEPQVHYVEGCS